MEILLVVLIFIVGLAYESENLRIRKELKMKNIFKEVVEWIVAMTPVWILLIVF